MSNFVVNSSDIIAAISLLVAIVAAFFSYQSRRDISRANGIALLNQRIAVANAFWKLGFVAVWGTTHDQLKDAFNEFMALYPDLSVIFPPALFERIDRYRNECEYIVLGSSFTSTQQDVEALASAKRHIEDDAKYIHKELVSYIKSTIQ